MAGIIFVFIYTIILAYYLKKPNVRYVQIGDKITFLAREGKRNAYHKMSGVVDYVSYDGKSYSINTGNSILVVPDRNYFGKTKSDKYLLHSNNTVYYNR